VTETILPDAARLHGFSKVRMLCADVRLLTRAVR